ncbi:ribonuclease HI [Desulfovibrio sp. OttesenSCG-928-A18]|nr:ribonuclease HI [Desulfovibrio sp. OttesenSCG-928-A18]
MNKETDPQIEQKGQTALLMHTDGSCLGNPGPGGWAARLDWKGQVRTLSGGFSLTTNNRMELMAAIMGLESLTRRCRVELYTDSRYVRDAVEKGWLKSWKKRGWKKADGKPALNRDLWERFSALLEKHQVRLHWLAGHAGHAENEEVDLLARAAASKTELPPDTGFSR